VEAFWTLVDDEWIPRLEVIFEDGGSYFIERLVAQYREGKELVVVEP
jgi:hypothetical protein